jgi:hypothetical protein
VPIGRYVAFFLLFAFISIFINSVIPQPQNNPPGSADAVWFVLEGGSKEAMPIIPAFEVKGVKFQEVPMNCGDFDVPDKGYKKFEEEYLRPGRTFQVIFGGANAGSITIKQADKEFDRTYGTYTGDAPIHGHISALATSGDPRAKSAASRKRATPRQEVAALELAKTLFAESGVGRALLQRIQIENMTVTSFLPLPQQKLVASFSIQDGDGNRHAIFFVADLQSDAVVPEFVWTHLTKTEAEVQVMRFIDQADLIGDGQEEIIAEISYYENWQYVVLSRSGHSNYWQKTYETDVRGCE